MSKIAYKEDALIIYFKLEKKLDNVRAFLEHLEYSTTAKSYKKVTAEHLKELDLIVLVTPENIPINGDTVLFEKLLKLIWESEVPVLGLGDINSRVMQSFGYETLQVENHNLLENEVHNILDVNNEEYFIPSQHITTINPDAYDFYNILDKTPRSEGSELLSIACISPDKDSNDALAIGLENNSLIIEIFLLPALKYLGVYGAPENFFSDNGGINKISKNTLTLLEILISDLK